jgi:exodeoxyribonuclease V alpha subunit
VVVVTNSVAQTNEFLTGVVERLTFYAEDSGYTVARFKVGGASDLLTIVGNFANIQPGQTLKLQGSWREHPQHGQQFQVVHYQELKPATLTGIEKYLGSGLIKGVGPVTAKRIVAHFGLETLEVIESSVKRLIEVPGIGKKRVRAIAKAWIDQKAIKEVMIFLQGHGVSTVYAVKIYKEYGKDAIAKVTDNPYRLAKDIYGIGFLTADKIAQKLGVSPWAKSRYYAGIFHILQQAAEEGHCYLPQPELVESVMPLLNIGEHETEASTVESVIQQMCQEQELVVEVEPGKGRLCYRPTFFHTERNLAQWLKQQLAYLVEVDQHRVKSWLARYTQSRKIDLSPQQQQAVEMAASARVSVLTGGPGCGKTFTTRTIVALWRAMDKSIALCAPTGRAAQRLSQMSGLEAKTVHRLLEFDPATMGFKRDAENVLPYDAIIVDEASMLDLFLAYALFKAVATHAQILLVGDVDQLPSVGPGKVLQDLIESGSIPVVRLEQVFRQAQQSAIIRAAHQINRGQFPNIEPISDNPKSDCLWHGGGTQPEHGVQTICELLRDFIPGLGFNPVTDVQVLCPMSRGMLGTRHLNRVLQEQINPFSPDKGELFRGGMTLRVGDRILQLKNDYTRNVFNGDLGTVVEIVPSEQEVTVRFDERLVIYDYADLNEVTLAWATTIHKSQGSEYPVVILPLHMQHYIMLSRNLFYTGLTRAKQLAIVIGPKKALAISVNQLKEQNRYTRIQERLR